ncbi:hypothetical protein V6N13_133390 [Hibiscus sabdariffa]
MRKFNSADHVRKINPEGSVRREVNQPAWRYEEFKTPTKEKALSENVNRVKYCEKVTVLISSQNVKKTEELAEIGVGNVIHLVRVMEIGFSDSSGIVRKVSSEVKVGEGPVPAKEES